MVLDKALLISYKITRLTELTTCYLYKMRYWYIVLFGTIAASLVSCSKEVNSKPVDCSEADAEQLVAGSWKLYTIFNPLTNETVLTKNTGEEEIITFNVNNSYKLVNNDGNEDAGTWKVDNLEPGFCDGVDICISEQQDLGWYIDCDELVYDLTPVDGPRKTYKRR